ncbi:hypothetical protein DFA_09538 [Cavenderia fasciculata]|uniref:Uncharacterized protein n=1 Tax=Cavenderia fasciculata TaxID=261658 RepID=F4Q7W9_CACFS|nr:uncharacterized protein DFA_09538 [Cavenderia fasciculata]EGG15869.1 hypothetical protein DFA_09538 [Cavenderia fasciculata]|eukprot:XP_004352194.1 hypothetical protein DFA_09538 [Cavenderia fasciculata]
MEDIYKDWDKENQDTRFGKDQSSKRTPKKDRRIDNLYHDHFDEQLYKNEPLNNNINNNKDIDFNNNEIDYSKIKNQITPGASFLDYSNTI